MPHKASAPASAYFAYWIDAGQRTRLIEPVVAWRREHLPAERSVSSGSPAPMCPARWPDARGTPASTPAVGRAFGCIRRLPRPKPVARRSGPKPHWFSVCDLRRRTFTPDVEAARSESNRRASTVSEGRRWRRLQAFERPAPRRIPDVRITRDMPGHGHTGLLDTEPAGFASFAALTADPVASLEHDGASADAIRCSGISAFTPRPVVAAAERSLEKGNR